MLTEASDLIDALGGNAAVAEICDVGVTAVCNWRTWGRFPPRVHNRLRQAAKRKRLRVAEDLFANETAAPPRRRKAA